MSLSLREVPCWLVPLPTSSFWPLEEQTLRGSVTAELAALPCTMGTPVSYPCDLEAKLRSRAGKEQHVSDHNCVPGTMHVMHAFPPFADGGCLGSERTHFPAPDRKGKTQEAGDGFLGSGVLGSGLRGPLFRPVSSVGNGKVMSWPKAIYTLGATILV